MAATTPRRMITAGLVGPAVPRSRVRRSRPDLPRQGPDRLEAAGARRRPIPRSWRSGFFVREVAEIVTLAPFAEQELAPGRGARCTSTASGLRCRCRSSNTRRRAAPSASCPAYCHVAGRLQRLGGPPRTVGRRAVEPVDERRVRSSSPRDRGSSPGSALRRAHLADEVHERRQDREDRLASNPPLQDRYVDVESP